MEAWETTTSWQAWETTTSWHAWEIATSWQGWATASKRHAWGLWKKFRRSRRVSSKHRWPRPCWPDICFRNEGISSFSGGETEQRAKERVLDDREFAEHLGSIHLDQAGEHLAPVGHGADVPQLVAVLVEGARLDLVDVSQAGEELILFEKHLCYFWVWDGLGLNPRLVPKLSCSPDEGNKLVVIQVPHPHAPSRLHPITSHILRREGEVELLTCTPAEVAGRGSCSSQKL